MCWETHIEAIHVDNISGEFLQFLCVWLERLSVTRVNLCSEKWHNADRKLKQIEMLLFDNSATALHCVLARDIFTVPSSIQINNLGLSLQQTGIPFKWGRGNRRTLISWCYRIRCGSLDSMALWRLKVMCLGWNVLCQETRDTSSLCQKQTLSWNCN